MMLKAIFSIIVFLIPLLTTAGRASHEEIEGRPPISKVEAGDSNGYGVDDYIPHPKYLPEHFEARQNYPNPFNATTTIEYDLPQECGVYAVIYNVLGLKVRTLANVLRIPGKYKLEWDGRNDAGDTVASGVYFYLLVADDDYAIRKMLLLK